MTMMKQSALTIIIPVSDEQAAPLRQLLTAAGQNISEGAVPLSAVRELLPRTSPTPTGEAFIEFHKLTTVHFLRFVLLDPARDAEGQGIGACLAFSTDYDGPLDAHLDELIRVAEPALATIFSFCNPPPAPGQLKPYLLAKQQPYAAFYCGHPGRSVRQIWGRSNNSEEELRLILERELDRQPRLNTPGEALAELRKAAGQSGWTMDPTAGRPPQILPIVWWGLIMGLPTIVALVCFVSSAPWPVSISTIGTVMAGVFLLVGLWGTTLNSIDGSDRQREQSLLHSQGPPPDPDGSADPYVADRSSRRLTIVTDLEDQRGLVQNQMTHIVNIRPGPVRLITLRAVLGIINVLARTVFVRGKLGDIETIHFARWVLIDDNRRLLFFSNYDFSWDSYLGDFIDLASDGLTGIWCNTTFFPQTRVPAWTIIPRALKLVLPMQSQTGNQSAKRLFEQGARREQAFKKWTRDHQVPTQVWYSAYPQLSVTNVNGNSNISKGLHASLSGKDLDTWLRRL
jgi:hypothetical protein